MRTRRRGRRSYRVDKTDRYMRVRIVNPKKGAKKRTLTFSEEKGYKAVRQKLRGKPWETQAILIERRQGRTETFAKKKAKELAEE